MVPAVLYGESNEAGGSIPIAVPTKTVDYTLQHLGDNALYNLTTSNAARPPAWWTRSGTRSRDGSCT